MAVLIVYVDDIVITGDDYREINNLKASLAMLLIAGVTMAIAAERRGAHPRQKRAQRRGRYRDGAARDLDWNFRVLQ